MNLLEIITEYLRLSSADGESFLTKMVEEAGMDTVLVKHIRACRSPEFKVGRC